MDVNAEALQRIAQAILAAAGSSEEEAGKVAQKLVGANLAGHDSHGVIRVPQYVDQVRAGHIVPNRNAEVVSETDVVTVLDGHGGYGQILGEQSVQAAIDKARAHGIALSALRGSAHLGRLGDWAEMAAAAGMASLHFVNATGIPLRVVPHGGRDGRGTTNPLAMGVPVAGGEPVVLDFATSAIAEGKVRVARNKGVQVPPECLLDAEGRPTTDPARAADGALLPVAGHKGYAIGLAMQLFGVLVGGDPVPENRGNFGFFFLVVDPALFGAGDGFRGRVEEVREAVKGSRRTAGTEEILLPGEGSRRRRERSLAQGFPINRALLRELRDL